jgi:hypothetical protein
MSIEQIYASNIRDETGLFATWVPNAEIGIGDYGPINGVLFQPINRLDGIDSKLAPAGASYDFTIHAQRSLNTKAEALADAGVSSGKALLEVSFNKEAGVTFSAPDARITRVQNIEALGAKLIDLYKRSKWNKEHGVVFEVYTASQATIIVSNLSGAQMKFVVAADTPVSGVVMAKLDIQNSLVMEKGIGLKIVGKGPLTPLFRLAFLKPKVFHDPQIVFRGQGGTNLEPKKFEISEDYSLEIY